MRRNIFYASNTQSDLFPQNKRTKFDQSIDIHSLDYIQQNEIEVAVKSISFDNKRCINIEPNISEPHFLIVQEIADQNKGFSATFNAIKDSGKGDTEVIDFNMQSNLQDYVDIKSSNDFVIGDCNRTQMLRQPYENREFSNVIWIMGNKAIHHIYMHKKVFFYVEHFCYHINNIIKSITFYNTPSVKTNLISNVSSVNYSPP